MSKVGQVVGPQLPGIAKGIYGALTSEGIPLSETQEMELAAELLEVANQRALATVIRQRRIELGLSQEQLADSAKTCTGATSVARAGAYDIGISNLVATQGSRCLRRSSSPEPKVAPNLGRRTRISPLASRKPAWLCRSDRPEPPKRSPPARFAVIRSEVRPADCAVRSGMAHMRPAATRRYRGLS
jgi:hypothetical protein